MLLYKSIDYNCFKVNKGLNHLLINKLLIKMKLFYQNNFYLLYNKHFFKQVNLLESIKTFLFIYFISFFMIKIYFNKKIILKLYKNNKYRILSNFMFKLNYSLKSNIKALFKEFIVKIYKNN